MNKRQISAFCFDVYRINHGRMAALEELRRKLEAIAKDEGRLRENLLSVASPEARQFLGETTIIEDLFAYGLAERKIDVGEYPGMGTVASIKRVLKSLHTAWSGAISVEIGHAEGGRVEVKFRAIGI